MNPQTIERGPSAVEPDRTAGEAVGSIVAADRRFFLTGIRWSTYEALLADIGDGATRLSFNDGELELMSPGIRHERFKSRFGRLIEALTEELDIAIEAVGSFTVKDEALEKGLEPDESFYIRNESKIRDKGDIDFSVDPPPDLAIEIDITNSSVDREGIYAAFGVPEIWRYDGKSLRVMQLGADGKYEVVGSSLSFPYLPLPEFVEFHDPRPGEGQTAWAKRFKVWVRERLVPLHQAWLAGPDAW